MTTADGTWQTRGWHSKNATCTTRNYLNGALLYILPPPLPEGIWGCIYHRTLRNIQLQGFRLVYKTLVWDKIVEHPHLPQSPGESRPDTAHSPSPSNSVCVLSQNVLYDDVSPPPTEQDEIGDVSVHSRGMGSCREFDGKVSAEVTMSKYGCRVPSRSCLLSFLLYPYCVSLLNFHVLVSPYLHSF